MAVFLGSSYGGHWVEIDAIPEGAAVIDAGVGEDTSFLEELYRLRPDLRFVLVDHSAAASAHVVQRIGEGKLPSLEKIVYIPAAIWIDRGGVEMYFGEQSSDSVCKGRENLGTGGKTVVATVCLLDLIGLFQPALVKLDIEGAEYYLIEQLIGVKQLIIEFHEHRISSPLPHSTEHCLKLLESNNYRTAHAVPLEEYTFILEK